MAKYQHLGQLGSLKALDSLMKGNLEQLVTIGDNADLTSFRIANKTFLLISSSDLIKKMYSIALSVVEPKQLE